MTCASENSRRTINYWEYKQIKAQYGADKLSVTWNSIPVQIIKQQPKPPKGLFSFSQKEETEEVRFEEDRGHPLLSIPHPSEQEILDNVSSYTQEELRSMMNSSINTIEFIASTILYIGIEYDSSYLFEGSVAPLKMISRSEKRICQLLQHAYVLRALAPAAPDSGIEAAKEPEREG